MYPTIQPYSQHSTLNYVIETGEAAFYGPKLDFMVKDALGRKWQLGTIQVDYNLPERFEVEYVGDDNTRKQPVMIHRAILGSFERFIGILTEHYAGEFPIPAKKIFSKILWDKKDVDKYLDKLPKIDC